MPTILVADDNSNIQKMVTLALTNQGIEVVAVGNGEAAVRKLADMRPDLILADIFMPVRNGYEVCEFIKKDDQLAHIPVILLVGAFDPLDEHEVQRVGADGVLKKPFVPPDPLVTMVKALLEKTARSRQAPAEPATPVAPVAEGHEKTQPLVPEPDREEFEVQRERVEFREAQAPVAFGELLETAPAKEEAAAEEEWPASTGASVTELKTREETESEIETEEEEASPWRRSVPEGAAVSADMPPIVSEESPAEVPPWAAPGPFPATGPEVSAPTERASGQMPQTEEVAPPAKPEVTLRASPIPTAPAMHPAAEREVDEAAAGSPAPVAGEASSMAIPQPLDPAMIEAVVEKVLERLEPQLLEQFRREVVRPLAEAILRRNLDK